VAFEDLQREMGLFASQTVKVGSNRPDNSRDRHSLSKTAH